MVILDTTKSAENERGRMRQVALDKQCHPTSNYSLAIIHFSHSYSSDYILATTNLSYSQNIIYIYIHMYISYYQFSVRLRRTPVGARSGRARRSRRDGLRYCYTTNNDSTNNKHNNNNDNDDNNNSNNNTTNIHNAVAAGMAFVIMGYGQDFGLLCSFVIINTTIITTITTITTIIIMRAPQPPGWPSFSYINIHMFSIYRYSLSNVIQ